VLDRVRFAGLVADVSILILGALFLLGCLAAVLVVFAMTQGVVEASRDNLLTLFACLGAGGLWAASLIRDLRRVRVIQRAPDGAWLMRGVLGISRGRLPQTTPREVIERERETWILVGPISRYTQSWTEIRTPDRTWHSCHSIPSFQRRANDTLRAWMRDSHGVSDRPPVAR
jgi:hypothetical protein